MDYNFETHKNELLLEGTEIMALECLSQEQEKRLDFIVHTLWHWYGTCLISYYTEAIS